MNIKAILTFLDHVFYFFMENDFFKPTHPTKVWRIPYFFLKASLIEIYVIRKDIFGFPCHKWERENIPAF